MREKNNFMNPSGEETDSDIEPVKEDAIIYDLTEDKLESEDLNINKIEMTDLNINLKLINPSVSKAEKIMNNIKSVDPTSENISQFRNVFSELGQNDILYLKSKIQRTLVRIQDYIEKNREVNNLYTVFYSCKQLIETLINSNQNLQTLGLEANDLKDKIYFLEEVMNTIITKQMKMKKTRKNLKEKYRLQRRLNEARDKFVTLEELKKKVSAKESVENDEAKPENKPKTNIDNN